VSPPSVNRTARSTRSQNLGVFTVSWDFPLRKCRRRGARNFDGLTTHLCNGIQWAFGNHLCRAIQWV
jgi:hypothetical protein